MFRKYKIYFSPKAEKELEKLEKDIREKIREKIKDLENFPFCRLDIKKLKGFERKFRIRIGKYRVIFGVYENSVWILKISKRENIYGR